MPFEDVSIGILAERCGFKPTMIPGIKVFRADTPKERGCVKEGIPMSECYKDDPQWPPKITMDSRIVQHRVETRSDMNYLHSTLGFKTHEIDQIREGS